MPKIGDLDMPAFLEALVPALVAELMKATKTEMEPLIDGCLSRRMDAAKPAEMPAMGAEDMAAMQAKADAEKARADAAEAKLNALEAAQRKERAATLSAALAARGLKPAGYDLARADASDIAAAERALLDHELASKPRADWGEPKPAADKAPIPHVIF